MWQIYYSAKNKWIEVSECKFLDNSTTFLCRFCKRDFVLSASHNDTQKIFHKILFIMPTHYILTPGKKWFCTNLNEKGYKNSHFNQFRCRGFARARIKIDNHMIIKIGLDWIFFHVKQQPIWVYYFLELKKCGRSILTSFVVIFLRSSSGI